MHSSPAVTRIGALLVFLACCQGGNSSHRRHHRHSPNYDERWLGFKFISEPSNSFNSSSITLHCSYSLENKDGIKTEARLEWRRDGTSIGLLTNGKVLGNGTLRIAQPSLSDAGVYQCVVHINDARGHTWTYLSRRAQVRPSAAHRFASMPSDQTVPPGQSAVFHCILDTPSVPSVKWYFNNRVVREGGGISVLPVSNSLEIHPVLPRHAGVYRCEVSIDGDTRVSPSAKLVVDATVDSSDVEFLSAPRAQSVLEGQQSILECLTSGSTGTLVEWLRDGSVLVEDGTRVRRVGVASLLFTRILTSDAGTYTCRANRNGDVSDRSALLQVKVPPLISTGLVDRIALETTDVQLDCSAHGHPAPSVLWFKNGEALVPSEYFIIGGNKLSILGLVKSDQGVYQCLVENDAGSTQSAAQLLIDSADSSAVAGSSGKPLLTSAPLGLRTTLIGARAVGIEWDPPLQRHGTILNYHIYYKEENSDRERSVNTTATSVTISSLQPETLYIVRVVAENEAGLGSSSDHIKVPTVREQAVPGRVSALAAFPVGSETIEVRWDPPPLDGPQARRYRLFYIRHPAETNEKETQITVSSTHYTLHGMEKFAEYAIRVEAEGENGSGLTSESIKVRTLSDVPSSSPEDVVAEPQSSTSIRMGWKPPPSSDVHGELTGFRIKYKTKQRGGKTSTIVIDDPLQREHVIDGLEANQQYQLRMAAVNQNGTGPFSDWVRADTPAMDKEEKLLGAPVELKPIAGGDYILVTWKPPSDDTTIVRAYQIGWGNNVPDLDMALVGAGTLQYKISGLQPGKEYVISVRAKNNVGLGYPIYETVRTAASSRGNVPVFMDSSYEPPETPIAVHAVALSASSMRVSWTDPDDDAFNVKYTVKYSTSADGNKQHYSESSEPFAVIESLRPATEYEFAVRSSQGGAESMWSMAARNRTLSSPPSSAPRDLSLTPAPSGDPHQVVLNWQPPKYANGELIEYLVYYSDRASLEDKDWRLAYVPADRLSHAMHDLLPKSTYYFKIQARNEMGYGPLSPVVTWRGAGIVTGQMKVLDRDAEGMGEQIDDVVRLLLSNPLYLVLVCAFVLLVLLAVVLITVCLLKRSSKPKPPAGFSAGKTSSTQPGDLWINHPGGSHVRGTNTMSDLMGDGLGSSLADMKHLHGPDVVDSPPPRYQALQGIQEGPYGTVSAAGSRPRRTPLRASVSSYEDRGSDSRRPLIGRAKPMQAAYAVSEADSGTLSRSYHHSSSSLEQRGPRTPQVVYTGTGKHQPIARIEFDSSSPYGSSSQLAPPIPPLQAPPSVPPSQQDGYHTLRSAPGQPTASGNPLRSFTSLSGVAPPPQQAVRPIVIAAGGKQLPVGRATAQPRVNVANIYSPYASCSQISTEDEKKAAQQEHGDLEEDEHTPLQPSHSNEELNEITDNLDMMIDDLQAMQNDFGAPQAGAAWGSG